MSDGANLVQLSLSRSGFISGTVTVPPNVAPILPGLTRFPTKSPDGTRAVYVGDDYALHIVDLVSKQEQVLYAPPDRRRPGPQCWSSDGNAIIFMEALLGDVPQTPIVRSININGQDFVDLFSVPGLEQMRTGACSPDGRQMVVGIGNVVEGDEAGLFVIDLATGTMEHILTHYSIWSIREAP